MKKFILANDWNYKIIYTNEHDQQFELKHNATTLKGAKVAASRNRLKNCNMAIYLNEELTAFKTISDSSFDDWKHFL